MRVTGGKKRILIDLAVLAVIGLTAWFAFLRRQQIKAPEGVETIPLTARWLWDPESPDIQDWQILRRPYRIILGPQGELLVSDQYEARIIRFTTEGELIEVIGREGGGPGEFSQCSDLALDAEQSVLWVTDSGMGGGSLSRFRLTPHGSRFLDRFRIPQLARPYEPSLIVIDQQTFWIVKPPTWMEDHKRILCVNLEGIILSDFGDVWEPEDWGRGSIPNLNDGSLEAIGADALVFMWEYRPILELWSTRGEFLADIHLELPEVKAIREFNAFIEKHDDSGRNYYPANCVRSPFWDAETGLLYFAAFGVVTRGAVQLNIFDVDVDIAIYAYSLESFTPQKRFVLPTAHVDDAVGVKELVVKGSGDDVRFYVIDETRNGIAVLEPLK